MVKQSSKQKKSKLSHKVNPMTVHRPMRGIQAKFDGMFGSFRSVKTSTATSATNTAAEFSYIDCSSTSAMGSLGSAISNTYSEYVYESLTLTWLPGVSPGVTDGGSQLYIAYYDNVENISTIAANTVAANISAIKATKNAKMWNAWEKFVFHVPLTRRRKTFDVNVNTSHTVDLDDRSVQGLVLWTAESNTASATLGRMVVDSRVKLLSFNNIAT